MLQQMTLLTGKDVDVDVDVDADVDADAGGNGDGNGDGNGEVDVDVDVDVGVGVDVDVDVGVATHLENRACVVLDLPCVDPKRLRVSIQKCLRVYQQHILVP